jgi:pimeloyl-ACP methyl ester carboxylesterase
MNRSSALLTLLTFLVVGVLSAPVPAATTAHAVAVRQSVEGFADVNGVRLQYLDWGGPGAALIFVPGLPGGAHSFDDLAPAFTDRFRVLTYAHRGAGNSEIKGPYDALTLMSDLLGLMDALRVKSATLVGSSAGGAEVTQMAIRHPERVDRVVYLDGGYDTADPDARAAVEASPAALVTVPESALSSLDAYRVYFMTMKFPRLSDPSRIEPSMRESVVLQTDGTVKARVPREVIDQMYSALWRNERRDYTKIHCPVLAIFAQSLFPLDIKDPDARNRLLTYEQRYWQPLQRKSIEILKRDLKGVQIVQVPGSHMDFTVTYRAKVVQAMRMFLK